MSTCTKKLIHLSDIVAFACLLVPAVALGQTAERSRTEGLKETDRFIKAGTATTEAVANAKVEIQKTLMNYNTLVTQPSPNMKGDYKKLMKSLDSMNKSVTAASTKIVFMEAARDTYFEGRAATLKGVQDADLRGQGEQRMESSRKDLSGVFASLRDAAGALDPFRKRLSDQITFLGSDLNPSATASLKPQADKLNAEGTLVFTKVDEAIAKCNAYFGGLKAQH